MYFLQATAVLGLSLYAQTVILQLLKFKTQLKHNYYQTM